MNIRWIVCFKGDDNHNNTLLCTDLGEVKLKNVFSEISESTEGILTKFVISDYDSTKDPLNIRETQHNPSWNDDTADACAQGCKQIKYRTITVPVGKSLFMEVIHLTPYTQTNFTDAEVCDILEHLLIFLDNKKLILRALCQQMALDCGLYDRINSLLLGPRTEPAQLHSKLLDLALEIGKHICLSVKDHRGNAMLALTEEDINERLLVDINLSEINRLFVPTVLITSSDFLVHNDDSLCELYANKQSDCEFTVDIELPVLPSDTAAQRLSEVLMCRFLALDSTKKIVIRFRGLECDFNLNFIHGKEIRAVFENCTLMRGSCSHINLKELTIVSSKITASLVLPDGMEKVTLKNVNVAANGKLRLGRNCKTVVMRNISGNICVPYLQQNFCIEFNSQWSFELSGHDDEHIGRLLIENVTISGLLVVINQSVHTVILKNIILPSNSILLVQKSVKELLLETFLGTVHLYGAVQAFGPICVEVFDGKLKVEESGIGKRTKIALERAKLTKNAHLDKKISHVDLCDVEIAAGCSLKLHGSEQHISLKNCTGTVFFANIPCFEQIKFGRTLQAEDHLGVIPVQVFLCTRTVMGRMSRLVLHFLQFEENVRLCDNTKDIILKNIEIHDECSLVVGNNFEQLTLQNCRGRVVIPGVSFSEGKQTDLLLNGGQIRIVRLPDDIYDITAENIQFTGDLAFAMRVHAAEICNAGMCADSTITFANECQSLNLQGNVACIRVLAATTLKTLSLRGTDVSNNSQLLAVPVERFTAENVTMHHRTMSRADVPSVLTSLNIANRSTMVSITNTNVPVNITSIVRHVIRGESPLLTTPDSVFCLNEDPSVQLNELHLAHFHVHSNLEIVREILSLSLKEITAGSNSTIRVNKELESITIDNCLVNIDFTETRGLRSIVLSRTALIYNQVLHLPISYLNLSSVVIDQNVSLNECVKTAKLKDVRIEKDYTFKVNRNIHELNISGSVGIVNMSGIGGLDSMVLEQKHQIRVINGKTPNVTFLYISDYHFNSNMVLPNDIGTVFLRNVNIPSDHKLVLGNNCQHMVIESSHVRTELSRLTLLKSVILKRMQPAVLKTVLAMFSSVSKIIVLDMVVYSGTVLSIGANIVAVRLQRVTCYGEFRDGEKCSEISLLHCSGKYDFSKVALLKKLILIPMLEKTHPFVVVFPPLGHVEDLEIAYNFADAYFKDVLLKCVNLQRLIIHGLCLSDTNPAYSTPIFPNEVFHIPINDWQLEEKFTSYSARTERMYNQEEKKEIMNLKMNALVKIVFGVNMYSKLKSLKLLGFGLDGDNVELLRKFKALQTLFVDYDFSDKMLFAHLPAGLMTLEITRRKNLVCVNPEPKTFDPIALEHLKKHKNLRNLSLCGVLCADGNILQYLPAKLHVLKVTWSPVKAFNKFDGNITKRIVKKLILFLNDDFNNVGFGGNLIRKQCRDVFKYLGQFILFDALEELVVEKKHKMVSINPKTFKIK